MKDITGTAGHISCRTTRPTLLLVYACVLLSVFCSDGTSPPTAPNKSGPPPVTTVDTIAPATINSLQTTSPGSGSIVLQWIAPGDDGWTGAATAYDIRHSLSPITAQNWDNATQIQNEPAPGEGNMPQSFRVTGLDALAEIHFAMKSRDEVPNWSGMSNVTSGTTLQEYQPPSPIGDLTATALSQNTILLTFTATGDDGVSGEASEYDIRYLQARVGFVDNTNWDTAAQVTGEPTPKPYGEPESLLVTVPINNLNYSFAVKAADEVPNWSDLSNTAPALGFESYLWTHPYLVRGGEELFIIYRAPGDQPVLVELHRTWVTLPECGTGDYTLYSGTPEEGIYTTTFDFIDPNTHEYITNWGYFTVTVCVNGERKNYQAMEFRAN